MSAAAVTAPPGAEPRPGIGRLTLVELRKTLDTRSGFWLLATTVALTLLAAGLSAALMDEPDKTLGNVLAVALQPATLLMPVAGILLVTAEWTQRTAMITFALVPQRLRVVAAKVLAGLAIVVVAFAVCLACAALAHGIAGGGPDGSWSLSAGRYGQAALSIVLPMLIGLGFGVALLRSAPAIVLYFALPIAWSALSAIHAIQDATEWLDMNQTLSPLLDHSLSGHEWAQLGTSMLLWLLAPLAIGLWRVQRSDPR